MSQDDGDMCTIKGIWTEEANIEAEELMAKKTAHLTIRGENSRVIGNEVLTAFYLLTKNSSDKDGTVNDLLTEEYLSIDPNGYTRDKITKMIADSCNMETGKVNVRKSLHNTTDKFNIPKDFFYPGSKEYRTTIGRFLFNHYILNGAGIIEQMGFVDSVVDKNTLGALDTKVAKLYLEDIITRDQFVKYIDRRDNLGYWLIGMIGKFVTTTIAKPHKEVIKLKEKLMKDYKEELENHNIDAMNHIEIELVKKAKEVLKDDPGMEQYNSGELNFGNNYKVNNIMKGPVKNKLLDRFDFIDTSFTDGIKAEDLDIHANSILSGQYPASIGTEKSGYLGKKLLALLQMIELDEVGSDCGTKRLIPILITDKNKSALYYSYLQDGNDTIMLSDKNISNYIGKRMLFRSPMSCIGEKLCNKCAGELLYMLGAKQAGMWSVQLSHDMLNLALKAKHDSSVNLYHIDIDKIEEEI